MPSLLLQHQQRLPKVSLLRKTHLKQTPKPLRPRHPNNLDDNDDFIIDDEVTFGRNRKSEEFGKLIHNDEELSDYVLARLRQARMLALEKYQEVWG